MSVFTISFAIQVRDWLIRVLWVGINQSRPRIVMVIINSENCYVIYLLRIINIQILYYRYLIGIGMLKPRKFETQLQGLKLIYSYRSYVK